MANKDRATRRVDVRRPRVGGGDIIAGGGGPVAPPALPTPRAPTTLTVTTSFLGRSAVTPFAVANLKWSAPAGFEPDSYVVQWARDAAFTNPTGIPVGRSQTTAAIPNLPTASTIYFRIAALFRNIQGPWSNTTSAAMPSDTTPPDPPSAPAATFLSDGTLRVSWTKPPSANFRAVEVRIFNSASKTVEYEVVAEADGTVYDWPAARNRQQTVGSPDSSPDPAVYVELRSYSWGGVYSTVVSASATKARPANVSGVTATWDGDEGSCTFAWAAVAGAVRYELTINGKVYATTNRQFVYTLAQNRADHSGSADPALTWSIVAVDALDQSSVAPATGTATLAPPATPTGITATWNGATGELSFRWTQAAAGVVGYRLTLDTIARDVGLTDRYVYGLGLNTTEHSGTPDPSITWALVAVDALGQASVTPATGTATLSPPATPTGISHPWSGESAGNGVASADWSIDCTPIGGVVGRRLTIDGIARDLPITGRYGYPLQLNAQEHSGTPNPALSWSLVWVDALGQVSMTPASGTATNAAPAPVSITLTAGGMTTMGITIGQSPAADLKHYRVRVYRSSILLDTLYPDTNIAVYQVPEGEATYTADVTVFDLFNQTSTVTTSAAVAFNPLTLAQLRAGIRYRDDLGADPATLKSALADDNRTSGGSTYTGGGSWHYTEGIRDLLDRTQTSTIAATSGQGEQGYLGISADGQTYAWFAGPLAADGRTLTAVASEAAAQAAPVTLPTNGRWQLPTINEARYVRLGHRATGGSYTLREFYPRRLVEADDIRAETIEALHIKVGTLTGDRLFGTELGALKASLGQVVIDANGFLRSGQTAYNTGTGFWLGHVGGVPKFSLGVAGGQGFTWDGSAFSVSGAFNLSGIATIGTSGGLYQGTGTFASPTTGLKIWNSSGVGRLATYNGGATQVELNTSGQLKFAGGKFTGDASGLRFTVADTSGALLTAYDFSLDGTTSTNWGYLGARRDGTSSLELDLGIYDPPPGASSATTRINLSAQSISMAKTAIFGGAYIWGTGAGLTVGTASWSANTGEIHATGLIRSNAMLQVYNAETFDTILAQLGGPSGSSGNYTTLRVQRTALTAGAIELQALRAGVSTGAKVTLGGAAGDSARVSTGLDVGSAFLNLAGGVASAGTQAGYYFYDRSGSNYFAWYSVSDAAYLFTNVGSANLLGFLTTGEAAIGETPTTNHRLRIRGKTTGTSGYGLVVNDSGGTNNFWIRDDGAGFLRAGAWTHSDLRAKQNFRRLDYGLAEILRLSAWRYDYRRGPQQQLGLIAQQVRQVLPELVMELPDGEGYGLNYGGLIPVLVRAVQQLATRIAQLEGSPPPDAPPGLPGTPA